VSRLRIPQRTRIYLGCEGASEQSYGKRLNEIADAAGLHLFFDCDVLQPGGGDPLALVQVAVRHIRQKTSNRGAFAHTAILLDSDKRGLMPERDAQISPLIEKYGIHLIWQSPCHEGFLLRHLAEQERAGPPSSELAMQALRRHWPQYRKGMPAVELAARIDAIAVRRAIAIETELLAFLERIELASRL
jgi:hypothetical protein